MVLGMGASYSRSQKNTGCKNSSSSSRKFSVLIVDDDPIIRKIHKMLLTKFDTEISVVENGKEAVDLCRSGGLFDLVLMDMEMPIMDGPKATQELRAMGVNSMIVGVTSRGLDSEKQAFIRAGLDDCHEKPLTNTKVSSILQELARKHTNSSI